MRLAIIHTFVVVLSIASVMASPAIRQDEGAASNCTFVIKPQSPLPRNVDVVRLACSVIETILDTYFGLILVILPVNLTAIQNEPDDTVSVTLATVDVISDDVKDMAIALGNTIEDVLDVVWSIESVTCT